MASSNMQIICLSSITKRSKGGEVSGYPGRFGHCSYLQVFQSGVARPTAKSSASPVVFDSSAME